MILGLGAYGPFRRKKARARLGPDPVRSIHGTRRRPQDDGATRSPGRRRGPATLELGNTKQLRGQLDTYSSTASFRVENFRATRDTNYTIRFANQTFKGIIRKDPKANNEIRVGALTCQGDFGFPHATIARSMQALKPNVLFFTGDQLYEANGGYAIQRAPAEAARLDYLRKWYTFGWAWGDLTRNTPCICLPDDHDVYHGNLWGASGRRAEYPPTMAEP